ncbi:MAG: glutamate--tRNA ligase [Planctomycetota bacterium]|nr:glutamate--tRNA ligase [Planctomycetota bacterium]
MADRPVRTRIAPSPTGDPHVGTAYMGLVNMVVARQAGGQFVLRIDDTDRARYRAGSEDAIFAALRWLGLEWDEGPDKGGPRGPYRQSERSALYREHADRLVAAGKAYRCFCSEQRLAEVRKAQEARKETTRYDRACRELPAAEVAARLAAGEPSVVRLAMPTTGETVVHDLLRGPITTPNADLQDQVLLKQDGFPTYHLASCVDDHLMEITHIIRAEEWISSAPIHKVLFDALGYEVPVLCHMPLLRNDDKNKTKISKRKNPTSILYYREAGYLPQGMLNFLGLMGWGGPREADGTQKEVFGLGDMLAAFKLEDIRLGGPVFDLDKLKYINAHHQRLLSSDDYLAQVKTYLFGDERRLRAVADLVHKRTETLGGFLGMADFFFGDVVQRPDLLVPVKRPEGEQTPADAAKAAAEEAWLVLADVLDALDKVEPWTAAGLEEAGRTLATPRETGWKSRDLFALLRAAVTGKTATPPLFESMEVLGKPRCLGRLGDALRAIAAQHGEPSKKARERWEKQKRERRKDADGAGGEAAA